MEAAPKNILRGHKSQVHSAIFIRNNTRLATGDADGYVVLWDLTIARPRAVWRAHGGGILGIRGWGDRIITHGRDHKLIVWQLGEEDEKRLSVSLPLEGTTSSKQSEHRPDPWILHIDIFSLPSQSRIHTVKDTSKRDTGMAMSISLLNLEGQITLIAAFENGHVSVRRLLDTRDQDGGNSSQQWVTTYRTQAHSQPILSLDVHPTLEYFISSGADAIIAKHPIPTRQQEHIILSQDQDQNQRQHFDPDNRVVQEVDDEEVERATTTTTTTLKEWEHPLKTVNTRHSGQQSLRIRSDGKIFATAGWDTRVRVYSCKTMRELAVLSWHRVGCYAVALAGVEGAAAEAGAAAAGTGTGTAVSRIGVTTSVKDRRIHQAKTAHWVAVGDKDGR
ncbi:WD40 repeat [Geosmithia morbida]|uniref:ASTRA-associated protein 1 n=1 Tax=Geosmithia morbida TaxID=1094350 RepID=A0A9P4Z0Z7_9HYPO|nr:WD40 repeat [Geosmithia morbida]KAF4125426.1 WD40 repeat [Geosmithia morbida]